MKCLKADAQTLEVTFFGVAYEWTPPHRPLPAKTPVRRTFLMAKSIWSTDMGRRRTRFSTVFPEFIYCVIAFGVGLRPIRRLFSLCNKTWNIRVVDVIVLRWAQHTRCSMSNITSTAVVWCSVFQAHVSMVRCDSRTVVVARHRRQYYMCFH